MWTNGTAENIIFYRSPTRLNLNTASDEPLHLVMQEPMAAAFDRNARSRVYIYADTRHHCACGCARAADPDFFQNAAQIWLCLNSHNDADLSPHIQII